MSGYPCPTCGAVGSTENCATLNGRDHVARWHLEVDVDAMRTLIVKRDVGFRYRGEKTLRHIWLSETERRPLTVREKRALQALIDAREIEPVHAVGTYGRGGYEFRGGVVGQRSNERGRTSQSRENGDPA